MLTELHQIVQRVNAAANLHEALEIIVHQVKAAMDTDVCSVYVRDSSAPQYVLMATEGLNPGSVGKIRMTADEGIIGLVATRQEPVNLANAAEHPSYRYFPETGEQQYSGFLAVPGAPGAATTYLKHLTGASQECYSTISYRSRVSAMNSAIDIWHLDSS